MQVQISKVKLILGSVFVIGATEGCVTGRYYDRENVDRNNPVQVQQPTPANPHPVYDATQPQSVSGLAGLGFWEAILNPSYYKKSTLGGKCTFITSESDLLGAPCNNVKIILKDFQSGEELTRVACSSNGEFQFHVNSRQSYLLAVESSHYTIERDQSGPYHQGQEVHLILRRR